MERIVFSSIFQLGCVNSLDSTLNIQITYTHIHYGRLCLSFFSFCGAVAFVVAGGAGAAAVVIVEGGILFCFLQFMEYPHGFYATDASIPSETN